MGYHPRIESTEIASFQTTRTRGSELWFVNNPPLERAILGFAAKFAQRYGVKLYAFAIEGNHIHFPALFPRANRAQFMRDFNSSVARAVPHYQREYRGGNVWGRRYSAEYLPEAGDIEREFFYTVLQPVQDGLVDNIRKYRGYNCFEDAIWGRVRRFKVVRWKEYRDALRWDPKLSPKDFTDEVELKFERLPGYEEFSQEEYVRCMREKLRVRTAEIVAARNGKPTAGAENLAQTKPGAKPYRTKTSTASTHRARVLSDDPERRARGRAWYFSIYFSYQGSSARYRAGEKDVVFPAGTYKPSVFTVPSHDKIA